MWIDSQSRAWQWKNVCTGFRSLQQRAIVFRKNKNGYWKSRLFRGEMNALCNFNYRPKRHIKICTTELFQTCLLASHTIRIPIARRAFILFVRCVHNETLSDHITFPFLFHFSKASDAAALHSAPRSHPCCVSYSVQLTTMYIFIAHIDTAAGMALSSAYMPTLRKSKRKKKKFYLKSLAS